MKKRFVLFILTGIMGLSLLFLSDSTLFANDKNKMQEKDSSTRKTHSNENNSNEPDEEQVDYTGKHAAFQTKVLEIKNENKFSSLKIDNKGFEMVLNVEPKTPIYDLKTNSMVNIDKLEADQDVVIVYEVDTPVTLSMPPIMGGVKLLIINYKDTLPQLGILDKNLEDIHKWFSIIPGKEMKVFKNGDFSKNLGIDVLNGSEILFLIKHSEVQSQIKMSASPKYKVDLAILLSDRDELEIYKKSKEKSNKEIEDLFFEKEDIFKDAKYVPLRKLAEEKGYKVEWIANDKPIILTKNDIRVEITINSKDFKYTHMTKDIQPLDTMDELDLVPILENSTTMISSAFIKLLI